MWLEILPYLLAISVGFRHAFETDHLVAVGNIVTKRNSPLLAMKDGVFWGLGHTSSILAVGILMLPLQWAIPSKYFQGMEGTVGVMIILLGFFRLYQFFRQSPQIHTRKSKEHKHLHIPAKKQHNESPHKLAYGVGIIHGLAGSGVLIVASIDAMKTMGSSLLFLLVFSTGCIGGMLVAAGLLGLPFSQKSRVFKKVQAGLIILSGVICLMFGSRIMIENWF